MMLIGDSANIKYDTGMDKKPKTRPSLIENALSKFREASNNKTETEIEEPVIEQKEQAPVEEEEPKGLMARR